MILHPLFHWSPAERRTAITRRGLRPRSRPVCSTIRMPYVCVATSPTMAWMLSAAVFGERGQSWDCWQVTIDPSDPVEVLPFHGNRPEEIRIMGPVPRSQIWLIGERTVPVKGRRW